jgi:signal transduction histidine kinase
VVADDGPGIGAAPWPAGHGLENTRERLHALHGDEASLTVAAATPVGAVATLRVPFREITLEARDAGR